jgi:glutathione S-transferase
MFLLFALPIVAGTPFGQMPLLTVDDTVLCQSHVIEEYLAREFSE